MEAHYSGVIAWIWNKVNHFDYEKYFSMREYICSGKRGIKAYYYLYRIKRIDSYHCSSLGTHLGFNSASFSGRPRLPHGLNGIIISNGAKIGRDCTILHQVTIGMGNNGSPTIGNNVIIGAGAKIIGGVHIGNNVKIGAGCIVTIDVPDHATVVMEKPRIVLHDNRK